MDGLNGISATRVKSRKCQLLEDQLAERLEKISRLALDGTFTREEDGASKPSG